MSSCGCDNSPPNGCEKESTKHGWLGGGKGGGGKGALQPQRGSRAEKKSGGSIGWAESGGGLERTNSLRGGRKMPVTREKGVTERIRFLTLENF